MLPTADKGSLKKVAWNIEIGYLDDNFHLQKAVFAFLGDDESLAKQKDVSITPATDDTEHILPTTIILILFYFILTFIRRKFANVLLCTSVNE